MASRLEAAPTFSPPLRERSDTRVSLAIDRPRLADIVPFLVQETIHITTPARIKIIEAVKQEANALYKRGGFPRKEDTLAVFAELGKRLGLVVSAGGHHQAWLYDLVWSVECKRDGGGSYTIRLPLVVESEERTDEVLDGDFIKLVQARADVRVWIAKVHPKQSVEHHLAECKEEIKRFEETKPDDVYVMMLYDKAGKAADFKCFEASTVMNP